MYTDEIQKGLKNSNIFKYNIVHTCKNMSRVRETDG